MRVVKPVTITDAVLTSSSIPEPDSGETEWTPGTYTLGARVIKSSTHRTYQAVVDPSTTTDPEVGVLTDPPSWVDVGATNRWAMFDTVNSSASETTAQLVVTLTPGQIVNSVAGFSIEQVTDANVTVTDPIEGIVYNQDLPFSDDSAVSDWYQYYFSPIVRAAEFILLDLPAYPNAVLTITFNGNNIKVGSFVIGSQLDIGIANFGTSVQLLDFSRKETDAFGNVVITPGRTSKLVNYDVTIDRSKVSYVFNTLSKLTSIPCVWVGTDDLNDETLVFGYYRDFQNNVSSPTITDATLTIEGLV